YLAAGATDVAVETGDTELLGALGRQYAAMERSQQYLTGGLGARWEGESFGDAFELPTDRAYAETCASIGAIQWAWRLLLATGEARYGDQIERMLLNGFLSGLSLAGTEYFYVNPLQLRSDAEPDEGRSPAHGRRGWFDCACCPPNIMRLLSSLASYVATRTDAGLQIHQYAPATITSDGLSVRVETDYPYDGRVVVHVDEAPDGPCEIAFRVPAWAHGATLDGAAVEVGTYARTTRPLSPGATVELVLPMDPRLTVADEGIDAVRGCVAIERGPLVYALEQADQDDGVLEDLRIDPTAPITSEQRPDLLGGTTVLHAGGHLVAAPDRADATTPYRTLGSAPSPTPATRPVGLTAIPYHLWANRGPQAMRVWIPLA
ncbi:MAG: beta-L-arabinofuranosidase domain-containing protein, partial [Lapillicoccus sp.]